MSEDHDAALHPRYGLRLSPRLRLVLGGGWHWGRSPWYPCFGIAWAFDLGKLRLVCYA